MNWSLLLVIIVSCSTEIFRCAATVNHGVNKQLPLTGKTFEEITVIASNDVVDEEATLTASNNEIGESDEYPGSLDAEKLALYRQLDSSKSIDELFQWVDEVIFQLNFFLKYILRFVYFFFSDSCNKKLLRSCDAHFYGI